jgi:hypothetical protein
MKHIALRRRRAGLFAFYQHYLCCILITMTNLLRRTASYFLFLLALIATLFSDNAAQAWSPNRAELEVMSFRSAIIVNIIILAILAGLAYLITQLVIIATGS